MRSIQLGSYTPPKSWIHQLDPRTKLLAFCLIVIAIIAEGSLISTVIGCFLILVGILLSKIEYKSYVRTIYRFRWMIGITFVLNIIFNSYGRYVSIYGFDLPVTEESFYTSLLITSQITVIAALSVFLGFITTAMEIAKALGSLLRPLNRLGIPISEIQIVATTALKFVPSIMEQIQIIIESQQCRGLNFSNGTILNKARNISSIIVPALTNSIRKADMLAIAMTSRGFDPKAERSDYKPLSMQTLDYFILANGVLFLSFSIAKRILSGT